MSHSLSLHPWGPDLQTYLMSSLDKIFAMENSSGKHWSLLLSKYAYLCLCNSQPSKVGHYCMLLLWYLNEIEMRLLEIFHRQCGFKLNVQLTDEHLLQRVRWNEGHKLWWGGHFVSQCLRALEWQYWRDSYRTPKNTSGGCRQNIAQPHSLHSGGDKERKWVNLSLQEFNKKQTAHIILTLTVSYLLNYLHIISDNKSS